MKYGRTFIKRENVIILDMEKKMLETVMQENDITNSQDIYIVPDAFTDEFTFDLFKAVYISGCIYFGVQPKVNPINEKIRHTPPEFGSVTLLKLISIIDNKLPQPPELESNGTGCGDCGRSLPEPDGFGGVYISYSPNVFLSSGEQLLVCFDCYQKAEASRSSVSVVG